jgi:hypothetical protein
MADQTPKDPTAVMAKLTTAGAANSQVPVEIDPDTKISILLLMLNQKINTLLRARDGLVEALKHNPSSPTSVTAALQGIDAEVNLCLEAIQTINASKPIQFPDPDQIKKLSATVRDLGNKTAQGAATAALLPAITDVINTFPR